MSVAESTVEPGLQADQRLIDRGWLRIGAGAAVAGQAMVFSLAINVSEISGGSYVAVHGILIFAALATLFLLGQDLMRSAWEAVRARTISIDLLFLVTLLGALVGSLVSTFTRTGSVYYEVIAILIVVHTAGKMLGARSRVAALRAVSTTRESFGACDVLQTDGSTRRLAIADVPAGERVRVAPGGAIAVDGIIRSGVGYVQETAMTGEWRPASRGPGDRVLAGTHSLDGTFVIENAGGVRKLDSILQEIERARIAPSALQDQADRLIAWFLPLVVGTSAATFLVWWKLGPWEHALYNAMAVLLVACPCAMGLATPVAIWSGLARLAQLGLVARTGDFLDRLARADVVCLDKTGTLSSASMRVLGWRILPTFSDRADILRGIAAACEAGLNHPIAEALRADSAGLPMAGVELLERQLVPGRGVTARVRISGVTEPIEVAIGERGIVAVPPVAAEGRAGLGEADAKRVFLYWGGQLAAEIHLGESWRKGLVDTLRQLQEQGVSPEVLSGDSAAETVLADVVGQSGPAGRVVIRGGMTPMEKTERVQELRRSGRIVVFAGDGLNDAAALSAADASIAVKSGTDLARASAMAVLAGDDLRVLPSAIRISRDVRRSIRSNLLFAAAYNLVGVVLAALGWLHPVVAALLMLGSSLFVSVRALRSSALAR